MDTRNWRDKLLRRGGKDKGADDKCLRRPGERLPPPSPSMAKTDDGER